MKRSTERILTSHTGALHRPMDLQQMLLAEWTQEPHDESAVAERLREAVGEVVRRQADLGIDVVNDGEYSKSSWMAYAAERMSGFEFSPEARKDRRATSKDRRDFHEFYTEAADQTVYREPEAAKILEVVAQRTTSIVCTGPVKYTGVKFIQRDIENLTAALQGVEVEEAFLPVVGPGSIQPVIVNEHYPDDESLFAALADALREEYRAVVDAGLICQIDDAFLPWEYDRRLAAGDWDFQKYREWAELAVEALNVALEGLPEDRIRYHICWGSWNGPHSTDIPLRDIVDLVLRVKAQTYSIEAANARHEWEYKVWRDVKLPEGKILMPGVIEHTTHVVEHPETVADRILRFATIVGRENVIAGTDCGFRGRSHPQIAWAKMKVLSEGAALASKELWAQ